MMKTPYRVTLSEYEEIGIHYFLSPEERAQLTETELEQIKDIEAGLMPGGMMLIGCAMTLDKEAIVKSSMFVSWSAVSEVAYTEDSVCIRASGWEKTLVIGTTHPLIAKGLYNLIGWYIKRFFNYPKFEPVKTSAFDISLDQFNTLTSSEAK